MWNVVKPLRRVACVLSSFGWPGVSYDIGAFPRGDGNRPWIAELDAWLAEIGKKVFCRVPFKIAGVGFEIQITSVFDIEATGPIAVPQRRDCGILVPVGQQVQGFPST
jgi:hypothetical protein